MQRHATPCNAVQHGATPCNVPAAIAQNEPIYRSIARNAFPCNEERLAQCKTCNLPASSRQSSAETSLHEGRRAMLDAMVQGFFLPAVSVVGGVFFAVLAIIMTGGPRGA